MKKSTKLRQLIHRQNKVLVVLHPPTATHARIMEQAGCEAGFVGTSGVVGSYTGLSDVGTATMTECVQIAGWIASSVNFPIILDGDTGHGGIMAVRRLVRECIRAGIAGVRIDDQPIEGKRRTQTAGVDWVQLESPRSTEEIKQARAAVEGPLSFMKGKLPRFLGLDEHLALGINIAWYPGFTHQVMWAALHDFMQDFQKRGVAAWEDFQASRKDRPYPCPDVGPEGEGGDKQRELEERYLSATALDKYKK